MLTRLTLRADRAEELMQELFLKLHRSPAFARAHNPRAYAFRTAIHLALDARKHTSHKSFTPLPETLASRQALPLDSAIQAEQAQRLMAAVAELSPQAREAAVLHFIEQRSFDEAAALMEKTPHQVRALCSDALRQLRAAFQISAASEVAHE